MRSKGRSFFRQLGILIARNTEILLNSTGKMILLFSLPIVCGFIVSLVAGDDMFTSFQDSQTGYFVLCCAVVFTGVFNSIQEICKERSIIKREYCANLGLGAYICSKLCVQAVICAVQAVLILFIFSLFSDFSKAPQGLVFPALVECGITLFLLNLSSDATGLFISSLVRTADVANIIAPVFLVLQVVFSGVLFSMNGIFKYISFFMVGRWAMEALGSSGDIAAEIRSAREIALSAGKDIGRYELNALEMYDPTAKNLITAWVMLSVFIAVFSFLSVLILRSVARDTR